YSSVLLLVIVCLDHLSIYIPDFTHFNLHSLMLTRRLFSNYYKNKAIAPQRAKPDRLSPQIKQRSHIFLVFVLYPENPKVLCCI
ncbi:MAG: hypothetical protein ACK53E_25470, partial [Pseudanabaena sp.]